MGFHSEWLGGLVVAITLLPRPAFADVAPNVPPVVAPADTSDEVADEEPDDVAEPEASPPAKPAACVQPVDLGPPAANSGFQLYVGSGLTRPVGPVSSGAGAVSDIAPLQLTFLDFGIGAKIDHHIYLGVYLSGAGGLASPKGCDSCSTSSLHLGVEGQYSFRPEARWDPWVGYGLGFDGLIEDDGRSQRGFSGFEFMRVTAGATARFSHGFGIAPFAAFSLATYTSTDTGTDGNIGTSIAIQHASVHGWFTLGCRMVIFP